MVTEKKDNKIKEKNRKKIFLILAGIFVLISSILFLIPFSYEATEFYNVQEPYSTEESYVEWVSSINCDKDNNCICKHYSWFGLGSCDSCKCYRTRIVTKYKTVQKERQIYKKDILFNMIIKKTQYVFYE